MIRFKQSKLLVVSSATSLVPLPPNKQVIQIANTARIFPLINELKPSGLVLDYDYLGHHAEKILRRLAGNPYYSNIKVYCYKPAPHTRVDDLLKTLGVNQFIYARDAVQQPQQKGTTVNAISEILEASVIGTMADPSF